MSTRSARTRSVNWINTPSLVAGDIIATRSLSIGSSGIRYATSGQASHAILYTGYANAVDAMPDRGVTREQLYRKLAAASYAVVFRHRTATAAQCRWACQWAEHQAQLHKPYDFNSAARVGISNHTNLGRLIVVADEVSAGLSPEGEDAGFMCSELVFRAFEIAGAPLADKPAYCLNPGMLFRTKRLACLGRLV